MDCITYHLRLAETLQVSRYYTEKTCQTFPAQLWSDLPDELRTQMKLAADGGTSADNFESLGQHLFDLLFTGDALRAGLLDDVRHADADLHKLRLLVEPTPQAPGYVRDVPWEFLMAVPAPGLIVRFATHPNCLIIRYTSPQLHFKLGDFRVQLAVASPRTVDEDSTFEPINIESVWNELSELSHKKRLHLDPLVSCADLTNLETAAAHGANIFHLVSHGQANPPQIILINSGGAPIAHDVQLVADRFRTSQRPQVLFLHMCEGAAVQGGHYDIASAFVAREIPIVIAMQYPIKNFHANVFAAAFYRNLTDSPNIEGAFQRARAELAKVSGHHMRHFAVPVLYTRTLVPEPIFSELPFQLADAIRSVPFLLSIEVMGTLSSVDTAYRFEARIETYSGDETTIRRQFLAALSRVGQRSEELCRILDYPCKLWRNRRPTKIDDLAVAILQHSMKQHDLRKLERTIDELDHTAGSLLPSHSIKNVSVLVTTLSEERQHTGQIEFGYKSWRIQIFEDSRLDSTS